MVPPFPLPNIPVLDEIEELFDTVNVVYVPLLEVNSAEDAVTLLADTLPADIVPG